MSDLDVDIRAVAGASYGARVAAPDTNQPTAEEPSAAAVQSGDLQASQTGPVLDPSNGVAAAQPQFRYDSFRYLYRPDYGRVVLVGQNPETGRQISQIPSQRALQLYAEQRQSELRNALSASAADGKKSQAGTNHRSFDGAKAGKGASGGGQSNLIGPAPAKAASAPSLPTPSPAFLAAAFSPVNITI